MELSVQSQLREAAFSLLLGCAAGIVYDFLRMIRRRIRVKGLTGLLDALFWTACGVGMFVFGMSIGRGEQRLFMWVLAVIGAVLYFCSLSKTFLKVLEFAADVLKRIVYLITRPAAVLWGIFRKIHFFSKNYFQYKRKWYKIIDKDTHDQSKSRRKDRQNEIKTSGHTAENNHNRSHNILGGVSGDIMYKDQHGKKRAG